MAVGIVSTWNDANYVYVEYLLTEPDWYLTETHLAVGSSLSAIPRNKPGNPKVGHFPYSESYDVASMTVQELYAVPLNSWVAGTQLVIAAHAAVVNATIVEAPYYASTALYASQGTLKNGNPVLPERSIPENGLVQDYTGGTVTFFSMGFGGEIEVSFDCPVMNGEGDDVAVWEVTNGTYPPEIVDVYGSMAGEPYTYLGQATNGRTAPASGGSMITMATVDLGPLPYATWIKLVDVSDPTLHIATADSYDLDGISAIQDCIQIEMDETAWAQGTRFTDTQWAMYFMYTVQEDLD